MTMILRCYGHLYEVHEPEFRDNGNIRGPYTNLDDGYQGYGLFIAPEVFLSTTVEAAREVLAVDEDECTPDTCSFPDCACPPFDNDFLKLTVEDVARLYQTPGWDLGPSDAEETETTDPVVEDGEVDILSLAAGKALHYLESVVEDEDELTEDRVEAANVLITGIASFDANRVAANPLVALLG